MVLLRQGLDGLLLFAQLTLQAVDLVVLGLQLLVGLLQHLGARGVVVARVYLQPQPQGVDLLHQAAVDGHHLQVG